MKTLLNAIASMFRNQLDTSTVTSSEFKQEHPSVALARAEAKEKMKQWGRKTMLEGGEFSRNMTVLRKGQTKTS